MEATRGQSEANFQKRKFLEPAKAGKEAGSIYAPHKNSQRNFRFRKRKIQSSATSENPEILFPPLGEDEGTKGPMIIEAEIGGTAYTACHHLHTMELLEDHESESYKQFRRQLT
ncbi:hypothetical protein Tco_1231822, partial [Tanacetum coccineum]